MAPRQSNGTANYMNGHSNGDSHGHANEKGDDTVGERDPFVIKVSLRFIVGILVTVAALSYAVGRISISIFLQSHPLMVMTEDGPKALPPPLYSTKKEIPHTVYSSKHYDTGAIATSDTLLARRPTNVHFQEVDASGKLGEVQANLTDEEEEIHEPAGQHLLIDIKSVDGVFLNSEERLAQAMVDLVNMSGLTMLSYHCHGLEPVGVSCVGVLLESHISFHTWPIPGVITLDLFTCGPNSLLPLLPDLNRLFGVPRVPAVQGEVVEKPHMQWAHKKRGFRDAKGNPEDVDLNQFLLGWIEFDMKEILASEQTPFQKVEIYEVINPRFRHLENYKKSLTKTESYESQHPDIFRPEKIIYLDGIMQSRLFGEAAYHEALVHPAMVTHPDPKRVAIIGGGEGSTLREVLKHNTVEKVTMIEIDEQMVNVSRTHIPEWSDCSTLVGSTPSCFDDPRAEVYFMDAVGWFIERYLDGEKVDPATRYDVIIMDALDPTSVVEFSDVLYDNDNLMRAISNALGNEGIFVAQVGEDDHTSDPGSHVTKKYAEDVFIQHLISNGFVSVQEYAEMHGGFLGVWSYLVAYKDHYTKTAWYSNQAEVDMILAERAMPTVEGVESPFRFFDGATMMTYQYPSRVVEDVFCRGSPTPPMCDLEHGFDPERMNTPITAFEVKDSTVSGAGRGVFAKVDIPKGSYFALEESVHDMQFMPTATEWILEFAKADIVNRWKMFDAYMYGYGFQTDFYGEGAFMVDPGILTFTNHGCDDTNNMEWPLVSLAVTEKTANPKQMCPELMDSPGESQVHNPFARRTHMLYQNVGDVARRDIKAGEEILDTYLHYYIEENWERGILDLRTQCSAQGNGSVTNYETAEADE